VRLIYLQVFHITVLQERIHGLLHQAQQKFLLLEEVVVVVQIWEAVVVVVA
jgi:hypothetical protein